MQHDPSIHYRARRHTQGDYAPTGLHAKFKAVLVLVLIDICILFRTLSGQAAHWHLNGKVNHLMISLTQVFEPSLTC